MAVCFRDFYFLVLNIILLLSVSDVIDFIKETHFNSKIFAISSADMKLYCNFINFWSWSLASRPRQRLHTPYVSNPRQIQTRNVGQCPTWSTPQSLADAHYYMPCSNAAKTQSKSSWNLVVCPKSTKRWSQPLVGWSSPYCGDIWRTYAFFRLSIRALVAKI